MMIESPTITVGRPAEFLKNHLSDPANLAALLPAEHVQDFKADGVECQFKVTGGFSVVIKNVDEPNPHRVKYVSQKGTPIRFELDVVLEPQGEDCCSLQIQCDADLNPFMKMMAEKPLQAIFSGMAVAAETAFPA
jgi:carbon monoxide dehydrogenase subunit G